METHNIRMMIEEIGKKCMDGGIEVKHLNVL
jgi:hypothetical protein